VRAHHQPVRSPAFGVEARARCDPPSIVRGRTAANHSARFGVRSPATFALGRRAGVRGEMDLGSEMGGWLGMTLGALFGVGRHRGLVDGLLLVTR